MSYADLKTNHYVVINNQYPCKIVNITTSAPGKHGHAKKVVVGKDVITDKKHEQIFNHHTIIETPDIKRTEYQLNYIDEDGYMSLMDCNNNNERCDLRIPENYLGNIINDLYEDDKYLNITILTASFDDKNFERVVAYKEQSQS